MNKEELRDLAEWGARRKVAEIERLIDTYQKEFPHIFISLVRPVLLKAELREHATNSNGHGGYRRKGTTEAMVAAWTPERRAKQAARMKKRIKAGLGPMNYRTQAKAARDGKPKANTVAGKDWKNKWYQRLKAHGPERLVDTAKVLGLKHSSSLVTSSQGYLKSRVIVKDKDGLYQVGPTPLPATN